MNLDLPAGVTLDEGRGGLPRLTVATDLCTAELYLHGAHLCRLAAARARRSRCCG